MPRKIRIATGIYRDAYGFEVRVLWRGRTKSCRRPLGTSVREMQTWRETTLAELVDADPLGPPRSFREAAREYLRSASFRKLASSADRARDVATWTDVFGDTDVGLVHAREAQAALDKWTDDGLAAATTNHRIDAIVAVVPRLRGQLKRRKGSDEVLLPPPRERIARVLAALRPGVTKSRLAFLFWLGVRPSQLERMTLDDFDFDAARVSVPPGKGGRAYIVPLSRAANDELRPILSERIFGRMSRGSANRSLGRACRALGVPRFSVYMLRRSFGSTLRSSGADLSDVQKLLGHARIATSDRYAPVVEHKLVRAVEALSVVETSGSNGGPLPFGD